MLVLLGCTLISIGRYELKGDTKLSMVWDDLESSWLNEHHIVLFLCSIFLLVIMVIQLSNSNMESERR